MIPPAPVSADVVANTLPIVAGILILGVAAQLLARRVKTPSVLFLILIGLALGASGIGVVTIETFGTGLRTIVGLSVAIIVFDGAFHLRIERIREASMATARLPTVGATLTFFGTAAAVRLFLNADWELSFLVGALLVATGPTVITPILEVVRVREHVATALESEGIVNDVTAAIVAVVIFEVFVLGDGTLFESVTAFMARLVLGVWVGALAAAIVYIILDLELTPGEAPQAARFLGLVAATGSFAVADLLAAEAGIAAAASAGIVLGNISFPHRETMKQFGRDLTLVVLSFVFISLAALIDLAAMVELGVSGIALLAAAVLVIRPIVVAVSTVGLERYTRGERLFLSAVGPRGIVPASVATLFAIELSSAGNAEAASTLTAAVFVVIFGTVVVEGGLARQIGDLFGVTPMRTIIVGGGRIGRALAERLENRGEYVIIVEDDVENLERAREEGFTAHGGDGTSAEVLADAGADDAKIVVSATENDNDNLLICQLAQSKFDVEKVFSRVNSPENVSAFETVGVTAIDAPMATALAIDNEIERPALSHWMTELGEGHDVQEIEVTASDLVGKSIAEINAEIPDGCIVAVVGRGQSAHVPSGATVLEAGDHITFLGESKAVRRAINRFHPHD
ncbi:MAG: cation:proton antiporter [Halobacteriota archaeon]